MPLQALYIKDGIIEHLRKEGNMSALVNDLLQNYYQKSREKEIEDIPIEEKKKKVENEMVLLNQSYKELIEEENRINNQRKLWEEDRATKIKEENKEYSKRRAATIARYMKDIFIIEEDVAREESIMYQEYYDQCREEGRNEIPWSYWLEERGYKRKEIEKKKEVEA